MFKGLPNPDSQISGEEGDLLLLLLGELSKRRPEPCLTLEFRV